MDNLIRDSIRLLLIRYPLFATEVANTKIEYRTDLKHHTAATDGKDVFLDPDYFLGLTEEERAFVLAHEFMHIKFDHVFRLIKMDGKTKDKDVWNTATDAIINANLERDGFKIKEGFENRPDALRYTAEEFYELLLKEKQSKEQNKDNSENANNSQQSEHNGDDHSMWEEAAEKHQNERNNQSQENSQSESKSSKNDKNKTQNERKSFSENRLERNIKAQEKLKSMRNEFQKSLDNEASDKIIFNGVGDEETEIPWEYLVRKEVEKNESVWSQRRSIAENNYAYRLEEYDLDEEAESEVMIDVSGSVDLDLVKRFLRILKPLLKHSKLKVGCFNEKFWGMVEIKTIADIDNFVIPEDARGSAAWTEDWDLAVRSFTRKREVNKFVFTDGNPCPGNMPKEDLKGENVIWIVYGNKNFKPCCGKVIHLSEKEINKLSNLEDELIIKR